jgi:hypothetical protein
MEAHVRTAAGGVARQRPSTAGCTEKMKSSFPSLPSYFPLLSLFVTFL